MLSIKNILKTFFYNKEVQPGNFLGSGDLEWSWNKLDFRNIKSSVVEDNLENVSWLMPIMLQNNLKHSWYGIIMPKRRFLIYILLRFSNYLNVL